MCLFKKEKKKELLNKKTIKSVAIEVGITRPFLTCVLNRKKSCSKLVAYCIVKCLDENAEILDYFDYSE